MIAPEGRSVQQLAEVLASLGASSTERAAQQGAVERIAECFESEVGVLVRAETIVASVGFRADGPFPEGLIALAVCEAGTIEVPGAGLCTAVVVPISADDALRLLLARSGSDGFSLEEVSLLRSLGRILATALDMLQLRDVLSQREQQLAEAQRVAGLGSFEWDLVALTASWSDGLYRMLGFEPQSLNPEVGAFLSFIHPADLAAVQQRVRLALAGEGVEEIEYRIVRRDGSLVWVRARSEVLRDDSGQPLLFRGTLLDVNASKLAEDALRAATARLRLLEALATAANEASGLEEILDVATREICAHTGWVAGHAYVPVDDSPGGIGPLPTWHLADARWCDAFEQALRTVDDARPRGVPGQVMMTRAAAWTHDLRAQAQTALDRVAADHGCRGSFAFPVCVDSDVTCVLEFFSTSPVEPDAALLDTINQVATQLSRVAERRRASNALATARDAAMESSRLKSDFLATMSHEIRTPMNGVIGLTSLLITTDLDERQLQYAEGVESASEALLAIINDILDLSKIEAGKLELDDDDFDLIQVIEEAVSLVSQTADRKGLQLVSHLDTNLPTEVRGDPARLRQVLLNLASNATKFTSDGEVVVRASMIDDTGGTLTLRFEVVDTGIGIPADAHTRLFEPFSQADASTTRKFGGTGLGLAISNRLVTAMGGELGFESEPGRGSTFWFTLPLKRQETAAPVPAPLPVLRILVVDGNASVRAALAERLGAWGQTCDVAIESVTAFRRLRDARARGSSYDVVLVDTAPGRVGGLALIEAIDADDAFGELRVVGMTRDAIGVRREPAHPRVAASLTKPVRLGQLRETLAQQVPAAPARPWLDPSRRTQTRGHVLVVEDNATNQMVAVGILRLLGYRTDIAANGFEALEALARTEYAAVLMDCQMPEMDGYTATGEIRRIEGASRHTPVIAMTASATDEDRERCLAAGMDDFLAKPVKVEHVDAALTRWALVRESAASCF